MASRRRRRGAGRPRGVRSTIWGLVILVLAGAGIWAGGQWADGEGPGLLRTLERGGEATGEGTRPLEPGTRIRVEVLNAGGVRGMAAAAKDELRDLGFDVVYFGNAERFDESESVVLQRGTDPAMALWVAEALGIPHVRADPDSTLLVEVTVRLGSTWRTLEERRETEDAAGEGEPSPLRELMNRLDREPEAR